MAAKINLLLKRAIDLFGSLLGAIVLSPFIGLVAIMIKLGSKGPVFFRQNRLGKNGKTFELLKFRTMVTNAENIGDGIFVREETDQRITKVGKLLRSTSLDELPQLLNVIKGEMSLVGPRPPVPYHPYKYENYSQEQIKRFLMKPGITGLAQIRVRNSAPWEKRITIDVEYIESFNVCLDIKILVITVLKLFRKDNIYLGS
ncbi:sugar transferase [Salimicrobium jeotgali]|uniref:Sugar transferase n=1 Tax=Salimicrobium jeotgali TaxID=1230341 RepID=K2G7W5_9BACI|nr:sugar transferase [Salimicrobium jeotgali]AKG03771.1 sugar transferase [Salimicrobium jeotgali]EKE31253.1 undecaprenyl-phosphate galactose phosphotransferase [Salimicrobium jeotgali]MBM7697065.1 lipopolysaccharide/colanic/teichoic acid biosynthesis glycosyltransferase [Salimicrobium jeotgali]